jgi:hypothetical protein
MGVALVMLATILAAVGGAVSWKMRLYGAIVGGMVVNAVAKAEGAGYEAALAAMVVVTALGVALGGAGRLIRLQVRARARTQADPGRIHRGDPGMIALNKRPDPVTLGSTCSRSVDRAAASRRIRIEGR